MQQARQALTVTTRGQGFYDITREAARFVASNAITTGLLTVFIHHTSASLVIQENADPTVKEDLLAFFKQLVPEDSRLYRHSDEGPDDMPAHIKTALTVVQLSIPVTDGRLDLGTWQGLYVFEHRDMPHQRRVTLHLSGMVL